MKMGYLNILIETAKRLLNANTKTDNFMKERMLNTCLMAHI